MQLFFGFALKISIIIFSFQIIHNFYDGTLKFTFSWLLAYCIMLINMLLLSFFSLLTGHNLIIGLFVSISVLILILKNIKKEAIVSHPVEKCRFSFSLSNMLTLLAIIALTITFVLLLYRNLLYYDTTDDALTQGMPKLAFIQQHTTSMPYTKVFL